MEIKKIFKKVKGKVLRQFNVDKALANSEKNRLGKLARYQSTNTVFFGKKLRIVDPLTFLSSYNEIFKNDIYKFNTTKKDITIIDCGANIGLATLYFKLNFPDAHIVAFEPDPNIFAALQENITSFGYLDVICRNEAVSDKDILLNFRLEGGHSGMIIKDKPGTGSIPVKGIRLKHFLQEFDHITFLKIDIEGEEVNVIPDIFEELKKVDYLFLEYHSFINSEQTLDKLLLTVQEAGMRYYIKEATNKPLPFINEEIFLNMDMLINIFCYRSN
jgi:FkbM family methyltransferase